MRRFPWRIFTRLFLAQVFLVSLAIGALKFRPPFSILSGLLLLVSAVWVSQRLVIPIARAARILERTREADASTLAELGHESFGELSELESSIEDLKRDLEAKVESLSLEREQQATLMSAISDAILAIDSDSSPLFFNHRFALLFGPERPARLSEIFRDPELLSAFEKALKKGRQELIHAIPLAVRDPAPSDAGEKTRRFFSLAVSPLRRANGAIYGAVGVFHDVTDLKAAEQIRIDFVANVSHELRTPLTAIKGYADTLAQDLAAGRPAERDFVEVIGRNTQRLMNLINDLLDLSSLESTDQIIKAAVNTEEITERVLKNMRGTFDAKKQEVSLITEAKIVLADARRLEQVLVNLLDNARKYTPEGGTITIAWREAGNGVVLSVKDTGPGIPLESQPRLFERFYRVDKARSREQGGTGLGLAIVKHILQRHKGSAWVESTPGNGATFHCRFPS